jgi:L-histidine Nalpha-methyltransferase / hercynylcysteine S-oxide synthase
MATSHQTSRLEEPIILDVRLKEDNESISSAIAALRTQILAGLKKPAHQRTLPTLLLYDERGLRLYDEVTSNHHGYYLFPAEEQILTEHGDDIVVMMKGTKNGERRAVIVELGAGSVFHLVVINGT